MMDDNEIVLSSLEDHDLEVVESAIEAYTPSRVVGGVPHLHDYILLAENVSDTAMVPPSLRRKPHECLAVMLYGAELGIGPMQAIQQINFIAGKPSMAAELQRGLVMQQGHTFILSGDDKIATAQVKRKDWDEYQTTTFTIEDAERAGLTRGDGWRKYPDQMLAARVTSKACRMFFPDVISGMSYTPEEVESFAADNMPPRRSRPSPLRIEGDAATREGAGSAEVANRRDLDSPTNVTADGELMMTEPQSKLIFALMRDAGIPDTPREVRLEWESQVLKREVTSNKTLTMDDASKLIDALNVLIEGEPEPPVDPLIEDPPFEESF